ncbi:MAG: hypothetical protein M3Z30_02920 [Gemmatimonadota bacterium]|nr:hypothetical protein [Gemmatimonadota bacterium]
MLYQTLSLMGAALLLIGFVAMQMRRMRNDGALFNALNFTGSGLLAWVAIHDRRVGFIILEVVWALVSIPPMYRALKGGATAPAR